MNPPPNYISVADCKAYTVYELHARNLAYGVFDGRDSFIGIRVKWDAHFLDSEFHAGIPGPHGTAWPFREVGTVDDRLVLKTRLGTVDMITGKAVLWDGAIRDGGNGWVFVDDGEPSESIHPVGSGNEPLQQELQRVVHELIHKQVGGE